MVSQYCVSGGTCVITLKVCLNHLENSSPKVVDEYVNELGDFKVGDFVRNKGRKYEIISILKGADKPYICNLTGMFSVGTKYFDATEIEKV